MTGSFDHVGTHYSLYASTAEEMTLDMFVSAIQVPKIMRMKSKLHSGYVLKNLMLIAKTNCVYIIVE